MRLWAFRLRSGDVGFQFCGGWRFGGYAESSATVSKFDFSSMRRGTLLLIDFPRRGRRGPAYREIEPDVYEVSFAGLDGSGRPRFASTVDTSARLGIAFSRVAPADDKQAADAFVQLVRRERASDAITRMIVEIT